MKVLVWLWFALVAFFAIIAIGEGSVLGSLIMLTAAILSFPPVWEVIRSKGMNDFRSLRGIGSVILLPVGIGVTMANPSAGTQARIEADREAGQHCLSGGEHSQLVERVKETLRNPSSFEHISTTISPLDPRGEHSLTMRFRAQNGFGGMNVSVVHAQVRSSDCSFTVVPS
jgi:hypothetical protein